MENGNLTFSSRNKKCLLRVITSYSVGKLQFWHIGAKCSKYGDAVLTVGLGQRFVLNVSFFFKLLFSTMYNNRSVYKNWNVI